MSKLPRCLKNTSEVPARGWMARQPETGSVVKGLSFPQLLIEVRKYREANGLPVEPNIRRQVENQICETLPPDEADRKCKFLAEDDESNPPSLRAFRSQREDLKNFALAVKGVLESAAKGTDLHVSQERANARASTCAQCPYNLPIANCWGCGALGTLYREIAGSRRTDKDELLRSCDVCGCDNKTQVHYSKEVHRLVASKQGLMAERFPDWCWKKEALS
jgi:hypothetical protein